MFMGTQEEGDKEEEVTTCPWNPSTRGAAAGRAPRGGGWVRTTLGESKMLKMRAPPRTSHGGQGGGHSPLASRTRDI
jgi:hypothetical protein